MAEEAIPIFLDVARGHSPHCDDVHPISSVASQRHLIEAPCLRPLFSAALVTAIGARWMVVRPNPTRERSFIDLHARLQANAQDFGV